MIVYRITGRRQASDLSGIGAGLYGGRWNKKGTPVLYTGENKEIALLEAIVHMPVMLAPSLSILTIDIPDDSIAEIKLSELPLNWNSYPAPTILSEIGADWIKKGKAIALKVPSCIIFSSYNYVLNCSHPLYKNVKLLDLQNFHFDIRLRYTFTKR
jgi:RES domain-containing protein